MPWYAVRSIYLFGRKSDGTNIFEERTIGFSAASIDEAFDKAEVESEQYAAGFANFPDFEAADEQEAFILDDELLQDGCELFSKLFEARESLAEFYANRYEKYTYRPE